MVKSRGSVLSLLSVHLPVSNVSHFQKRLARLASPSLPTISKPCCLHPFTVYAVVCVFVVQVRRWLDRVRSRRKDKHCWQRPAGLTDERRVHLQAKIQEWRETHAVKISTVWYYVKSGGTANGRAGGSMPPLKLSPNFKNSTFVAWNWPFIYCRNIALLSTVPRDKY